MAFAKKRIIFISCLAAALALYAGYNYYPGHKGGPMQVKNSSGTQQPQGLRPLTMGKTLNVKIPILMYHHIGQTPQTADATYRSLTVSTANFDQELAWLKQTGYNSISLYDIYLYRQGRFSLPNKPVVFSFDDGYAEALQNALPILKKYGYIGSFAIITQFPGTVSGNNTYASWNDIQAARQQGMEIVCHTENHFDGSNPKFDAAYVYQNLSGCKQDLQNHNIETSVLVYPYGHYTPVYLKQAQAAGFVMGVTVREAEVSTSDDIMQLPRVRVRANEDLQSFEDIILEIPPRIASSR